MLAAALDPIITIDPFGTIRSASNSVERVFGWRPEELIGRNVRMLMPEPHTSQHDDYLDRYRRSGKTNILGRTREFEAVRRDGARFPIELSVSRADVPGQGQPVFIGIIHDISERIALEKELTRHRAHLEQLVEERTRELRTSHNQLRQADRLASIGTLAAGLGHDMNNVLLPVRARLDAVEAMALPVETREHLSAIRRSIQYLQQLSDGLHLIALDPDDTQASTDATNLALWWQQMSPLLLKAVPKRVTFESSLPSDLPPVNVPPHRLTQAVLNLVVNAGEAIADQGTVRVWGRVIHCGDRQWYVQLGVSDTGEGMPPEIQQRALDPFFTTKKRGLGTGLGLSLVQGVMVAAGGGVEIDSEPGRGTTVTLTLPVAHRADGDANAAHLAEISLLDPRAASFVGALLEAGGYHVRYASADSVSDAHASRESGAMWITEPAVTGPQTAKRWLRADRRRRMILFSPRVDEWAALGVLFVTEPDDFESIRRTINVALDGMSGADNPRQLLQGS